MLTDIVDLHEFYQSRLGRVVRRLLRVHLSTLWPNVWGERILALGYSPPILRYLLPQAAALYAFMPAAQGVSYWPREGPNVSCLVNINGLPLPDNSIDRVIISHTLEGLAEPTIFLREIWRVMKSGARLLAIVPNRHGLWAHNDHTPFGNGQPYSTLQIKKTLHEQAFFVERVDHALYMLPTTSRLNLALANKTEIFAARLFPGFGGLLLVEASKQLYAPIAMVKAVQHRLVLPLILPVTPALPR